MKSPELSIVMSVLNSAPNLSATIESVLSQTGIDFEFIVIDDGSVDNTGETLRRYSDPRLIVLSQKNYGLTRSLIRGCSIARGEFVARQDAGGDLSLPGRFAHQIQVLRCQPNAVMTACGTVVTDPEGEPLYEVRQTGHELQRRLEATSPKMVGGPSHHGAVMFRKSAYVSVGGYRSEFRVAQDLDLWSRMAEVGLCLATPDVFYVARLSKGSISHLNLAQQKRATKIVLKCAKARREGREEGALLEALRLADKPARGLFAGHKRDAELYYHMGSILRSREPDRAHAYFLRALSCWPIYPRAWFRCLSSLSMNRRARSINTK